MVNENVVERPSGVRAFFTAAALLAVTVLLCSINTVQASATEKLLIVAPDLPGASEEGGSGRDAEIVNALLELCGYEAEFVVQPFGRHLRTYREQPRFDAAMTVPLPESLTGASTSAYIWYQNGAYYDRTRVEAIQSVDDLAGLHLVTFKDGIELLELNDLAPDAASVLEIADQRVHSKLLFLERVDAILADGQIIAEINRRLISDGEFSRSYARQADLRFAPIFPPSPYKMVFRDAYMAEEFDRCFDAARSGALISEINERHLKPLQHELRHRYLGF